MTIVTTIEVNFSTSSTQSQPGIAFPDNRKVFTDGERTWETPTPRELEIATMIAMGMTNKEMALQLGVSIRTVESHRANIIAKLGSEGRYELIRFARRYWNIDT